jgi:outer membrane protein W
VTQGPGSGLVGGEFILRYNFGGRDSRIRPFAQLGAGGLYNDIHKDRQQVLVGMGFEFMLLGGFGTHIMLGDNWALNLEADYRHISNAGLASRNGGLNSLGGTLGFSYFFR